ncbi:MAG: hypothetical protein SH807_08965 [Blastochloris sp.]|nr:hypothetical protein [Blastochloris sp.]
MDLGDFIIPLILVGGAVVQWMNSRKKENQNPPPMEDPFPNEPFQPEERKRTLDPAETSFEELMEALGQKPKQREHVETQMEEGYSETYIPPSLPTPAPVAARRFIPEPPEYIVPKQNSAEVLQSRSDAQDKRFANFSSFDIEDSVQDSSPFAQKTVATQNEVKTNRWRDVLHNNSSLKKAIILNEILQPPVALR